jgi:hypothetical protein
MCGRLSRALGSPCRTKFPTRPGAGRASVAGPRHTKRQKAPVATDQPGSRRFYTSRTTLVKHDDLIAAMIVAAPNPNPELKESAAVSGRRFA